MFNAQADRAGAVYVLAVFSERARGFAAPVDLLRSLLRVVVRLAVRRRLNAAFAGYLVCDPVLAFAYWRGNYDLGVDTWACTSEGSVWGLGLHGWGWHNGALDAPELIAAGSCVSCGDSVPGIGAVVRRGRV